MEVVRQCFRYRYSVATRPDTVMPCDPSLSAGTRTLVGTDRLKVAPRTASMNLLLAVKIMITHYFVKVEPDKNNPEDAVDWESMKAAIEVAKADIEKRFEEGILEKERRDCYIELVDAHWTSFFSEDEAGNPILTELAKCSQRHCSKATRTPRPPHPKNIGESTTRASGTTFEGPETSSGRADRPAFSARVS
ncbi:hypothetical protein NW767_008754 [Fusarium falciforme]|nr:hypothetical protein NW767_008754 [Fusarium falciforme]